LRQPRFDHQRVVHQCGQSDHRADVAAIAAYRLTVNSLSQAGAKGAGRAAGWHRLMSGDDTIAAREAWGETLPAWSDDRR
jgi:hypothetical protein